MYVAMLFYRSHVGAAILFWSWQRSVYVVAMFAYYHSHVVAAILFWSWQRSVYVVAMFAYYHSHVVAAIHDLVIMIS